MNDGSAPWIKIMTRIFEDPKMIAIEQYPDGYGIQVLWFKLLTLAGEQNRSGAIYFTDREPFTPDLLAAKWRCKPALVQLAIQLFQKYGMVGVDQEGTISILNWSKYQNEEGLARIRDRHLLQIGNGRDSDKTMRSRELAAERQRRHRQRAKQSEDGSVTRNALQSVTVTPQNKNKKENKKKERALSESADSVLERGGEDTAVSVEYPTAKAVLTALAKHAFPGESFDSIWRNDVERKLSEAMPIRRDSLDLITWAYHLPRDHEIFKESGGGFWPRESFAALVYHLHAEASKIRHAKRQIECAGKST